MSKRFVVQDARAEEGWERDRWQNEVCDTRTGEQVGADGGEPEDQSLLRDWKWVAEALNKVDAEVDQLRAQLAEAQAELACYRGPIAEDHPVLLARIEADERMLRAYRERDAATKRADEAEAERQGVWRRNDELTAEIVTILRPALDAAVKRAEEAEATAWVLFGKETEQIGARNIAVRYAARWKALAVRLYQVNQSQRTYMLGLEDMRTERDALRAELEQCKAELAQRIAERDEVVDRHNTRVSEREAAVNILRDMAALMQRCHGCEEDDDIIQAVLARGASFINGHGGMS